MKMRTTASNRSVFIFLLGGIALSICLAGAATADPLFPGRTSTMGSYPGTVAVGDVNGDGRPDLVASEGFTGEISVLLSRGDGTFLPRSASMSGTFARSIALADFTGDGTLDLALTFRGAFRVMQGDGQGHFFQFITVSPPSPQAEASALAVADFNGDDLPDVAVADAGRGVVDVYMSRVVGWWQRRQVAGGRLPFSVVTGDFNLDGKPDIAAQSPCATGDPACSQGEVVVLPNLGNEVFGPPVTYAAGPSPIGLITGDFNGDGNPDLAVGTQDFTDNLESGVSVLFGDGSGAFRPRIGFDATFPANIAVGDFDGDAIDDIALLGADRFIDRFTIMPGRADGLLREGPPNALGNWPLNLGVGDFNDDGRPDVAVTHRPTTLGFEPGYAAVYLNRGDGSFSSGRLPAAGSPTDVTGADLNEDGRPDLIALSWITSEISIHLNQDVRSFAPAVTLPADGYPTDAVPADFNGDGHADLAVSNSGTDDLSIFLGEGTGTLTPGTRPTVGHYPTSIAVGDFNGDGVADLVVTNTIDPVNYDGGDISVLLGNGDGTFLPESRVTADSWPQSAVVSDFDGDGHDDIAVIGHVFFNWAVSILPGLGDGTFAPARRLATPSVPGSLIAGDVNQDGIPDLAVAMVSPEGILVFLGQGDGEFVALPPSPIVGDPTAMALGDFDGDGSVDLAVVIHWTPERSDGVLLLQGDGSGAFTDRGHFVAGGQPNAIVAGDFDGDTRPDLAVTAYDAHAIALLYNQGRGPDADGDGVPDTSDPCTDSDGDGFGDPGFPANTCPVDNCREVPNPGQENGDGDPFGDACDRCTDSDRDGSGDPGYPGNACAPDNCPAVFNPFQADNDHDGTGVACDTCNDPDGDGFGSVFPTFPTSCPPDNCAATYNPGQEDSDGDGIGDACDPCPLDADNDHDRDGVCGNVDNCPDRTNPTQADQDGDGVGDACDNCPTAPNPDQADGNHDGAGDACQPTVRIYSIRQDGGPELEVFATAKDPQGEALTGSIDIIETRTSRFDLPDLGATRDCAAGLFPEGYLGEGIGFANGSTGYPVLFDFLLGADWFGLSCSAPSFVYYLAPGTCDVAVAFDIALRLEDLPLPASICLWKGGFGGTRFDATVLGYDASHIMIDLRQSRTFATPFSGALPERLDIFSLQSGADHRLRITATDGFTPPVVAEASFLYQGEASMTIGPPTTTVSDILMSFTSAAGKGSGVLRWTTDFELDLRGFNLIERDARGARVQLNTVLIPCEECVTGAGRSYASIVPRHKSGRNVFVEVVHADGTIDTFGPSRRE